jgi:hypothetical protein
MPLGAGYSAEEQITGAAEHGGLQIVAYPMKREAYERYREQRSFEANYLMDSAPSLGAAGASLSMGLAPGGRMRQKIYDDTYYMEDWDRTRSSRCFVHIANSLVWRAITGKEPPTAPPTSREYTEAGLPWFDLYDEHISAVEGSDKLAGLKSVKRAGEEKSDVPLPENESVDPQNVKKLRHGLKRNQVREGVF